MTTTRQRFVLVIVALVAVLVGGLAVLPEIRKPEPVRAYERLRLGMTRDEVQRLIGPPGSRWDDPNDYIWLFGYEPTIVRESGVTFARMLADGPSPRTYGRWKWNEGYSVWVVFDAYSKVVGLCLIFCAPTISRFSGGLRQGGPKLLFGFLRKAVSAASAERMCSPGSATREAAGLGELFVR